MFDLRLTTEIYLNRIIILHIHDLSKSIYPSIITIIDLYNMIHKYTVYYLKTFAKSLKNNLNSIDLIRIYYII